MDDALIHISFLSPYCQILKMEIGQFILVGLLHIKEDIAIDIKVAHRNIIGIRKGNILAVFQVVELCPRSYIQTILHIPCDIFYQNILIFLRCIRAHFKSQESTCLIHLTTADNHIPTMNGFTATGEGAMTESISTVFNNNIIILALVHIG